MSRRALAKFWWVIILLGLSFSCALAVLFG